MQSDSAHYEHALPEEALRRMRLLEAKVGMENHSVQTKTPFRQFGLFDLFRMITFVLPIEATIFTVKISGGGILRYAIAAPFGIVLGVLIVYVAWMLGRLVWVRFQDRSERTKNTVAMTLFVFQLFWIAVGFVSGDMVGKLIVHHLAR